jgi:hypothetical protein
LWAGKEWARSVSHTPGPVEGTAVQLAYRTRGTLEAYLTERGWEEATVAQCPVCRGHPDCRLSGHGTYLRKVPVPCPIARKYCSRAKTTFSFLPEFFASHLPGTLDELEHAFATAELAASHEQAAEALRPADARDAVGLPSATRWLHRRLVLVRGLLTVAVTLLPELSGSAPTVTEVRTRLGTVRALVALRGRLETQLGSVPRPLGFGPHPRRRLTRVGAHQHTMGPDPP